MREKAIVIGSGAAGLAAAAILAGLDYQVVLLESAPHTAPLLRGYRRGREYFDIGLHYTPGLAANGLLHHLLDRFGVLSEITPVALSDQGFDHLHWPQRDLSLALPIGLNAAGAAIAEAFPASAAAVAAYIKATAKILSVTPFLNTAVPPWEVSRPPHSRVSLTGFLRAHGAEGQLIDILGRYGEGLYGMNADETPFVTHALVVGCYLQSAHAIRGGGRALAEAFDRQLAASNVRTECSCPVERILVDEGRVTGVALASGDVIPGQVVIYTPHPALLPAMLGPDNGGKSYKRRLARLDNTAGMFLTYFLSPSGPADHNSYLFLDDHAKHHHPLSLAVMTGSPPAPGLGPVNCLVQEARAEDFGSAGERRSDHDQTKQRLADDALARLRQWLPELADQATVRATTSPLSFTEWTATPAGSAYGLKRRLTGYRLQTASPVQGLYLAGQSVLMPGVIGAFASSLVACCYAVGSERVWNGFFT